MKRFVESEDRKQGVLLPEYLDDYVSEDNPVRVVDAYVDELDLAGLGFEGASPAATGRPSYHPGVLLKIYIYGYLNRIQSSRRLERESQRNIELMWLTGRLAPDFKTIADFRRDNGPAIRSACAQFILLCRRLGLFTNPVAAIDGSKFKAINARDRNFTRGKLRGRIEQVNAAIDRYLQALDAADRQDSEVAKAKTVRLTEKISAMRAQMQKLKALQVELEATPDGQISLTDPDARAMSSSARAAGMVAYNVQTAVETEHHLIVAHEVTNHCIDRGLLSTMAAKAKQAMGTNALTVIADRGYFSGEEVRACEQIGVSALVPKPNTSGARAKGRFEKQDFTYMPEDDTYRCPAGKILTNHMSTIEDGQVLHRYWDLPSCTTCNLKSHCTSSPMRRITRWEHEGVVDAMLQRLELAPDAMNIRRRTAEHPFATLKCWMGATPFLTKGLKKVRTEMSLSVLAYNLKRLIGILGVRPLVDAMRA